MNETLPESPDGTFTTGELARAYSVHLHTVLYALKLSPEILPVRVRGITRLFDRAGAELLRGRLESIASRRKSGERKVIGA